MCMYEVLKAGGLTGGFNFDAKNRRASNTPEDMVYAYILGMDTFALGLMKAAELIESGTIDQFIQKKYSSFESDLGKKIRAGKTTLTELSDIACNLKECPVPQSGRQEMLQSKVNRILFP